MKKGRKISGGRYIKRRKRKFYEIVGQKRIVKLGEIKRKSKRTSGGNKKNFLLTGKIVNVYTKNRPGKKEKV